MTGLRVLGLTSDELMYKNTTQDTSKYDSLITNIKTQLGVNGVACTSFKVVTVRDYIARRQKTIDNAIPLQNSNLFGTEIYFVAKQNNKQISSLKAIGVLSTQLKEFDCYKTVITNSQCNSNTTEECPSSMFCNTVFTLSQSRIVAEGNATTLVGLNGTMESKCFHNKPNRIECYNSGTLKTIGSHRYCECSDEFEGPRCELTIVSFENSTALVNSYSLYDTLDLIDPTLIELEFTSANKSGLLLFNDLLNEYSEYFLSVEIVNFGLDVYFNRYKFSLGNINPSDKQWHKLVVSLDNNVCMLVCP